MSGTNWVLHPRLAADTHLVHSWPLSELLLMDDARYPWLILVPRVEAAVELVDLAPRSLAQLTDEIARASRLLQATVAPHKLNVAALGNVVPQLHVHVIARFTQDAAWPNPVWGVGTAERYSAQALDERLASLRSQLDG